MIGTRRLSWRLMIMLLVALVLGGCGGNEAKKEETTSKSFTVGVLMPVTQLEASFEGFKAGMADAGFVEGTNIIYVYNGAPSANEIPLLVAEAEKLKAQNPDLVLTVTNTATQAAKQVFTDVPIVAVSIVNPVEQGWADSLRLPGGNLTGINTTDSTAKAMEWLLKVVPDVKTVYAANNTLEESSVRGIKALTAAAEPLGVEIVVAEGDTPEEWDTITTDIPEDVDAVFFTDSGPLGARYLKMIEATNARKIPVFASRIGILEGMMLIGYGSGFYEMGQQAAHLADQILKGTNAGSLPIEGAELFLSVDLITAETLGIQVPEDILGQAAYIIRPKSQ